MQNTAGKNISLTDNLSRHLIIHDNEKEAEEELVLNQIYGLFEFNRTNGRHTRNIEQPPWARDLDQSQRSTQTRKQDWIQHSVQTISPPNTIKSAKIDNLANNLLSISKMDKVNGIDMDSIFKKRDILPKLLDYAKSGARFYSQIGHE